MSVCQGVAESTYRHTFKGELPTIPLIKYKTLPCMYPPGSTEPFRQGLGDCEPIPLRRALKAAPQPPPHPPSVAPPMVIRPRSSKRNKENNKTLDTKFGRMDMATINRLYDKYRYSTFTQQAGAEFALPVHKMAPPSTTKEQKPDMVRLRGQRYEETTSDWQDAVLWDRIQTRYPTQPPHSPCPGKLLRRRQLSNTMDPAKQEQILELVKKEALANVFVKKCPGYAGYAPLCPPETKLGDKKCPAAEMTSNMAASYRQLPYQALSKHRYAKTGVFSKTVRLTYPFNSFNKVGVQIDALDKEAKYAGMDDYLDLLPT